MDIITAHNFSFLFFLNHVIDSSIYKCGIIYVGAEKESKNLNSAGKKSDFERRKQQQIEALLRSADEAGQHRSLMAVGSRRSRDQSASDDDDSAAAAYQTDFRIQVLTALLRSIKVAQQRRWSLQRPGDDWSSKMDRETAACLYEGVWNLTTPVDGQLQLAIDEDVQSEGGHRAVVLQGPEGGGRSTALRRFVQLVAASSPELPPPVVVARRVTWPGRTSVDLLCDVVTQLDAVVNVADTPIDDDDDRVPASIGHQRVDLDRLVKSYSNLLRTFSKSSPGRLVIALDGLENVRRGGTVSGGDINWLSRPLPQRIHVVATYLTGPEPDTLSLMSSVVSGRSVRTVDVAVLLESAISHVVADAFRRRRRSPPVDGRLSVIMQLIGTKPRAAYVALLADEFASRSASTSDQLERPFERLENMEKIAKERFKWAERQYGKSVVLYSVSRKMSNV